MIQDSECDRVYLSALLPMVCPVTYKNLSRILDEYCVKWSFLEGTKDIWCRDYMPIQVDKDRFAKFKYNPDYLRNFKKYRHKITDGIDILNSLGYQCDSLISDIILDGGNVVRCEGKVVMTAKVFEENSSIRPFTVLERLETVFDGDVIVLPWDTKEIYGHADGICRYADDDTLIVTNYRQLNKQMGKRFYDCLIHHFKNVVELNYSDGSFHKDSWSYINWLQTNQIIILPSFGQDADWEAVEQIGCVMPSYRDRIILCECPDLVKFGGALNCCSWTIME